MLKIQIIGNVGTCRLVAKSGNSAVLKITLAINRRVADNEYTDWTSVKVWGERAEKLAPHISTGSKLLVIGCPEALAYKANDGTAKAELISHAQEIEFLSAKSELGWPKGQH